MNRRMIAKILDSKHNDFLKSITDPHVKELIDRDSIITGGSIASMLLNEKIKDFDYYFTNIDTVIAVANYYVNKFNSLHPEIKIRPEVKIENDRVKIYIRSAGVVSEEGDNNYEYFENRPDEVGMNYIDNLLQEGDEISGEYIEKVDGSKEKYRPVFMSTNAITLSDKVQLVVRFYGNADEIHKNYDFIHCCNYWTSGDKKLVLHPQALESLLCKHLQYQGSLYPVCSVIRTRKFLREGWYINAGQYLKMCFQISELNLSDIKVLDEQLTGVDAAYFVQIIDWCKKKQAEDAEFKVTAPYLISLIDKIFG